MSESPKPRPTSLLCTKWQLPSIHPQLILSGRQATDNLTDIEVLHVVHQRAVLSQCHTASGKSPGIQCIRNERLYANANIQRQDICDRFNLRREVLNQLLATNADGQSFPNYINGIRLSEACRLLRDEPAKTVVAIADEVGLSPRYLRRLFFEQYGVTPTEYRAVLPGT